MCCADAMFGALNVTISVGLPLVSTAANVTSRSLSSTPQSPPPLHARFAQMPASGGDAVVRVLSTFSTNSCGAYTVTCPVFDGDDAQLPSLTLAVIVTGSLLGVAVLPVTVIGTVEYVDPAAIVTVGSTVA